MPSDALQMRATQVLVRTLGEAYDGAGRLCALGMQLLAAVPSLRKDGEQCERKVVRTMRMPTKMEDELRVSDVHDVWARMLATIGGHVGRTVSKCVVRKEGESAFDAYTAQLSDAIAKLTGTAWLSGALALQHLLLQGAHRVADATPPLIRLKGGLKPAHDDAAVPLVFEVRCALPFACAASLRLLTNSALLRI